MLLFGTNKDVVIKSLTQLVQQKNAKIKKLTKKKFDNYGNGKYLILNFQGIDPTMPDKKDKPDCGGIRFWFREYDPTESGLTRYLTVSPDMVGNGSSFSDNIVDPHITCVKDCEFNYKQLRKFYSCCLHRDYFPRIRYYQARVGTVPALPLLKKFNLKE